MSTNPRREELRLLSQPLALLKKQGAINTINEALVEIYAHQGYTDIKSLRQWNKDGRVVRRGEKALLLWGRPKQNKGETVPAESPEEQDEFRFFPLAYVFDVTQTQPRQ